MKEITIQEIRSQIIHLPGRPPAMLDRNFSEIYQVETGHLNRAANRNPDRFPDDFRFRLTADEVEILRCQNVISSQKGHGGLRYLPWAYTREGCNMMSACLETSIAIQRSVFIMRAFSAMEADAFLNQQAGSAFGNRITGERFDMSVKRFKIALEAVRLMGITNQSEIRRIANKITKDTTGVDLMAFILPYCSPDNKGNKSEVAHHHEGSKEDANLIRFVTEWWDRFGENAVDSAHLFQLIAESKIPIDLSNGNSRSRKIRLGKLLAKLNSQQIGNYIITDAGKHRNVRLWKLKPAEKTVIGS